MQRPSTTRGLRHLGAVFPKAASATLRRRGFARAEVLAHWPEIVGAAIAAQSCPERLLFRRGEAGGATLHVRVAGGLALELQHLVPVVIERINRYFGYAAVARLSLVQGPMPKIAAPTVRPRRSLNAAEAAELDATVAAAGDDGVRAALRSLGRAMRERA